MTVIGTLIGERFRLEEKVGSGGMSSVYRAFDTLLERHVAFAPVRFNAAGIFGLSKNAPRTGLALGVTYDWEAFETIK